MLKAERRFGLAGCGGPQMWANLGIFSSGLVETLEEVAMGAPNARTGRNKGSGSEKS